MCGKANPTRQPEWDKAASWLCFYSTGNTKPKTPMAYNDGAVITNSTGEKTHGRESTT